MSDISAAIEHRTEGLHWTQLGVPGAANLDRDAGPSLRLVLLERRLWADYDRAI